MELSTEDVRPRVKQGMQWLDENYGLHWRESIDLENLKLWSPIRCVIGQLYGDYGAIIELLSGDPDVVGDYGFTLPSEEAAFDINNWDVLQDAWEQELS